MTITLDQIREEFPTAKYSPKPGCRKCNGLGKFQHERTGDKWNRCICLYVDHSIIDPSLEVLREIAEEMKKPEVKEKMIREMTEQVQEKMQKLQLARNAPHNR